MRYNIDPSHSSAEFSVRHLMITNVRGEFAGVTGSVEFDGRDLTAAKVSASVEPTP